MWNPKGIPFIKATFGAVLSPLLSKQRMTDERAPLAAEPEEVCLSGRRCQSRCVSWGRGERALMYKVVQAGTGSEGPLSYRKRYSGQAFP